MQHDSATGEEKVLVDASRLVPENAETPLEIKDYSWSGDQRFVLISTNTVKFRRYEPLSDYWLLNLDDWTLRQIGTADDNVHYQSAEQLVDKLIELNKTFSFMVCPDRSHSIDEKENTKRHLYALMTGFLHEKLPLNTDFEPQP